MNNEKLIKIFIDKELTKEIEELDLGTVQAGDLKRYTFYIKNISNAELRDLKFSANHQEVSMVLVPQELLINEAKQLIIEWKPSITLKESLKTKLNIKGFELYKAINIDGSKYLRLNNDFLLNGNKSISLTENRFIKGNKSVEFIEQRYLSAFKTKELITNISIEGNKYNQLETSLSLLGKRDITNILAALGVLD